MHVWGACNIGLQWSINGVLIETFLLVMGSRAEGGVASKVGMRVRMMRMKGRTVLDSIKNACMHARNIGLQWSINGVLIETFRLVMGSRAEGGVASKLGLRVRLTTMKGVTLLDSVKNVCMHVWGHVTLGCNGVLMEF